MNRPTPAKSDNFFILLFQALRQRRIPLVLRIASHSLLLVALALLIYAWVIGMQFKHAMQQQAEALGTSLITQTAASATELLVTNDILSLNVLLSNLVKNPLVAHAAIYSVDNRILAESGARPSKDMLGETQGLYSTPITFQEVIAGQLHISLDMQQFQQPMTISLQSMGILSLILLALTLSLSMRLGRHISTPLLQLRVWLRDPDDPAPGAGRQDEIGDLARQLQNRLVPVRQAPSRAEPPHTVAETFDEEDFGAEDYAEADDHDDLAPAQDEADFIVPDLGDEAFDELDEAQRRDLTLANDPDDPFADLRVDPDNSPPPTSTTPPVAQSCAVLAIQLGAQEQLRRLPRARLLELLQRYRDCLSQAAALYQGQLHTLSDGSSLMLFHQQHSGDEYITHAICCGELMRALGHALQIEVADSGITLQLQLALSKGEALLDLSQGDLLLNESTQNALALSQHSRNLLLVERAIADDPLVAGCARIRAIASPQGACCVERLLEPYPALLERQLGRMH